MIEQIRHMLEMQDALNVKISDTWLTDGNNWHRAIWVECAELMEHTGWKWWKAPAEDMLQAQLEVVDIFHFVMSIYLVNEPIEVAAEELRELFIFQEGCRNIGAMKSIERLAIDALNRDRHLIAFARVMTAYNLTLDRLYMMYIGKHALNRLRQDYGYKEGGYIKEWAGREDNQHLVDVLSTVYRGGEDLEAAIYGDLEALYKTYAKDACARNAQCL